MEAIAIEEREGFKERVLEASMEFLKLSLEASIEVSSS